MTACCLHSMSCLILYVASWAFISFLVFGPLFYMLYLKWGCAPVSRMQLDAWCHVFLFDYIFYFRLCFLLCCFSFFKHICFAFVPFIMNFYFCFSLYFCIMSFTHPAIPVACSLTYACRPPVFVFSAWRYIKFSTCSLILILQCLSNIKKKNMWMWSVDGF